MIKGKDGRENPHSMKNKVIENTIIDKFKKLSLHPTALSYLLSLGKELKIYHYYDLKRLNALEVIKNLPAEAQLNLIKEIIENRRKIDINNKNALMDVLLKQKSCDFPGNLWAELILSKISELEQLYGCTKIAVKGINKKEKCYLAAALKMHSMRNLDSIILIRQANRK